MLTHTEIEQRREYISLLLASGNSLKDTMIKCSMKFHIKKSSCYTFYYKYVNKKEDGHKNALLTENQNIILEGLVLAHAAASIPFTFAQISSWAVKLFNIPTPSRNWASMWVKARPDRLRVSKGKLMAKKRVNDIIISEVDQFCEVMEVNFHRYHFSDFNCVNYDETRIVIGENKVFRVFDKSKDTSDFVGGKTKALGSYIPFVSASGVVIMSVFIFPCKEGEETGLVRQEIEVPTSGNGTRTSRNRYYLFTPSGYLDGEAFRVIVEEFCRLWNLLHPGMHCYLLGDQLQVHMNSYLIADSRASNVFMLFLPANTSHFIQPLDNLCFADFKKKILQETAELLFLRAYHATEDRNQLLGAVYDAELKSFSEVIIKSSFKNTGIYPFSKLKLKEKVREKAGKKASKFDREVAKACDIIKETMFDIMRKKKKKTLTRKRKRVQSQINTLHQDDVNSIKADWEIQEDKEEAELQRAEAKRICLAEGCGKKHCRGKNWVICPDCEGRYCPQHRRMISEHIICVSQ